MADSHNDVKQKSRVCPSCNNILRRMYPRRMIFVCDTCDTIYKLVLKRKPRNTFDPKDSSTWKARCDECGSTMEYGNLAYHCMDCGNCLQV